MTNRSLLTVVAGCMLLVGAMVRADIRLPSLIADNMMLQRSSATRIWGHADPGEAIEVQLGNVTATSIANSDGRWQVKLDLSKAPANEQTLRITGSKRLEIRNVLVGEVWVCSGQSNMALPVKESLDSKGAISQSTNPQIRHFRVAQTAALDRQDDVKGQWVPASAETTGDFTAVGYFFAQKINTDLKVPVGLINASWGGATCEAFTDMETLATLPQMAEAVQARIDAYNKRDSLPKDAKNKPQPASTPTLLFNGMISPIIPYTVKGVLWYQCEGNRPTAWQYRTLFPAMIESWRRQWDQPRLPFLFCQMPGIYGRTVKPGEDQNAEIRDAQMQALALPDTAMAVLIDLGEAQIHPRNKKDPGQRLAIAALGTTYGQKDVFSGPIFKNAIREGNGFRITFTHTGSKLIAKPLPATWQPDTAKPELKPVPVPRPGSQLQGFAICGADRNWVWADATIDGTSVLVGSPEVANPVAVRYAWGCFPITNLYNEADLPASPFRTDDFPYTTAPK